MTKILSVGVEFSKRHVRLFCWSKHVKKILKPKISQKCQLLYAIHYYRHLQ